MGNGIISKKLKCIEL